jgi:glycosyltransferase involved in cell wall biosynthesis
MHPKMSVVIPARNERYEHLSATLTSIIEGRHTDCDVEAIIIDDDSSNDSCDRLAAGRYRKFVKVIRLTQRRGVPSARNIGARAATGEILFITDAHVSFCNGWDYLVLEHIRPNRVIAATIADPKSSFKGYGCRLVVPFMGTNWNRDMPQGVVPAQIAACPGTVLAKSLFDEIGGYDSGMIMYGAAEPEFSVRAWLTGAEVVCVPDLKVSHTFKNKTQLNRHIRELRLFMVHNCLRFGLLYLGRLASLQMMRHLTLTFPLYAKRAFCLLNESDVWDRKEFLDNTLRHDFNWFVDRFELKDQGGLEILRDK